MKDLDWAGYRTNRSAGMGGSPVTQTVDYPKHFKAFAMAMAVLKNDPQQVCYFGKPGGGNHHRVSVINTPAGLQFAFHRESPQLGENGLEPVYGSGEYVGGLEGSTESLIDVANRWLQDYYKPHPNHMLNARLEQIRSRDDYRYYVGH